MQKPIISPQSMDLNAAEIYNIRFETMQDLADYYENASDSVQEEIRGIYAEDDINIEFRLAQFEANK